MAVRGKGEKCQGGGNSRQQSGMLGVHNNQDEGGREKGRRKRGSLEKCKGVKEEEAE